VIGEGGVVVLVKLDVEIGGLPDGEVIFPFGAGVVVSGDGFFACGAAERFHFFGGLVHQH